MPEAKIGIVVIGRNEGARLRACLRSAISPIATVVYVDSGSSDDSLEVARDLNVHAIALEKRNGYTAARARNCGFKYLIELGSYRYVQFVDGDCELAPAWLVTGARFLESNQSVAVVSGRLREKYPERSIFNRLCDMEWDAPTGEVRTAGGIAMFRADAFADVHGFTEELIAGEEPELCARLRNSGWRIWRVVEEMGLHDAAMTRYSQWWKRSTRTGYGRAEVSRLLRNHHDRVWRRETYSAVLWGLVFPLTITGLMLSGAPTIGAIALTVYPLQVVRLAFRAKRTRKENWLWAFFIVFGKFPEAQGVIRWAMKSMLGRSRLIEYK